MKIKKSYCEPKFYNHIAKTIHALHQSHFIEVAQGDIFMQTEKEIWARFGPVSDTEKKTCADYDQLLMAFFFMFSWMKKV